jgi:hypothetical protein
MTSWSEIMRNINRFLVLGLIATAALFATGMASTVSLQEAYADQSCHQEEAVVGVCANVCAQVNVIAKQNRNVCDDD